jgi:CheY-like chemotaxis protein
MQVLPTILVVEDDDLIQSVVEETLKDGGFEIHIASSAKQAVEKFDGASGKYRVLVTDINLGPTTLTVGKSPATPEKSIPPFPWSI